MTDRNEIQDLSDEIGQLGDRLGRLERTVTSNHEALRRDIFNVVQSLFEDDGAKKKLRTLFKKLGFSPPD